MEKDLIDLMLEQFSIQRNYPNISDDDLVSDCSLTLMQYKDTIPNYNQLKKIIERWGISDELSEDDRKQLLGLYNLLNSRCVLPG